MAKQNPLAKQITPAGETAKDKALATVLAQLEKDFGKGTIMTLGDDGIPAIEAIPTGSIALDAALGIGGIPKGRICEIYGPEGCLDRDTFLQYEIRSQDGKRQNHKGGTIESLYLKFNRDDESSARTHKYKKTRNSDYFLPCMNEEGRIFQNKVIGVVDSGTKECYELCTENGEKITATKDHKFFTGAGYQPLGELEIGSTVFVHNKTKVQRPEIAHALKDHNNLRYTAVEDTVISIEYVGTRSTYDVQMQSPHNNYIANKMVVHNSGKTTLCYHLIAECQKQGGRAAFIDAEHAMDLEYAQTVGVDPDALLISQPDYGEQALEIAIRLTNSGAVDLIVIDSVAALTPRAELEGQMGDATVGLQARMMGSAMRKIAGSANRTKCTIFFTNQIREKVGVTFGCFHYNSRVMLADGTSEKIGNLVTQKMDVEVLSMNSLTGLVEPKRILNWFNNGKSEYFLQIEVAGGLSGTRCMSVTPNHMIFTPDGEIPAGDLRIGNEVFIADYRTDTNRMATAAVTNVSIMQLQPTDDFNRYDIEVEGNHSYLVDGIAVHNSPETQPGGRALKFYASVRMDIRPAMGGQLKDKEEIVGRKVKVKMVKNKVAPPFRIAEMDLVFGEGISHQGEILDLGLEHGLLKKSGAFWSYGELRLGQGREASRTFLKENVDIADEIEGKIRNAMGIGDSLEVIPDDVIVAPELGEMPDDEDAPILIDD